MKKHLLIFAGTAILLVTLAFALLPGHNMDIMNPQGVIADRQRELLIFTVLLSMVVIVPVFVLLFVISWKYRQGNKKPGKYTPDWDSNKKLEVIWWGIPCAIILILGVITWRTSHELDPYKPLTSATKPVTVQVVALQWKWLFIYPEQHVASVNFLQIPEKTPVNFKITADAPMNSFWIPSLGGQVYAMSGMSTQLHLMADRTGDYDGSSANISGEGFAKMRFTARASSPSDFDAWVANIKQHSKGLTAQGYDKLAAPDVVAKPATYTLQEPDLYDKIVAKYMAPSHDKNKPQQDSSESMPSMQGGTQTQSMPAMEGM